MKARFDSKPLDVVATVKTKTGALGYVTRVGLARVRRKLGKGDVFFPERQARGFTFMRKAVFLSSFLEIVEEEVLAMTS